MALDNLLVQLGLNTKAYDDGLKKATKTAEGFSNSLKSQLVGAFGAAAISGWVKHVADVVAQWKDVSEQFGITTTEAQQLEEQAKKSGRSLEDITAALAKLNQARQAAIEGDDKMVRSFSLLGVALKDLKSDKSSLDLFKQMGLFLRQAGIDGPAVVAMMETLGKKGKAFQGVLKDINNEGVNLVSEEAIERIDRAVKALELMKQTATQVTGSVLGRVLGGDLSDASTVGKGMLGRLAPEPGKPFFGYGANVAQILSKVLGGGIGDAAYPTGPDLVSHGALPLPASRATGEAQLKVDLESLRLQKEEKEILLKILESGRALQGTGALGGF